MRWMTNLCLDMIHRLTLSAISKGCEGIVFFYLWSVYERRSPEIESLLKSMVKLPLIRQTFPSHWIWENIRRRVWEMGHLFEKRGDLMNMKPKIRPVFPYFVSFTLTLSNAFTNVYMKRSFMLLDAQFFDVNHEAVTHMSIKFIPVNNNGKQRSSAPRTISGKSADGCWFPFK